jgi:hypothetical protein
MLFLSFVLSFGLLTRTYADLPFLLGDIPIAVKAPYLHAWVSGGITTRLKAWPTLYTRDKVSISKIWATFRQTDSWNTVVRVGWYYSCRWSTLSVARRFPHPQFQFLDCSCQRDYAN